MCLATAAFAQSNGAIRVTPGGTNTGTKILANADSVTVEITSNSSPAGAITIEVRFDPPCAPAHNESTIYTMSFSEGQRYTFAYACAGDIVSATLIASGPGIQYDVSATPHNGTNAHETGSL